MGCEFKFHPKHDKFLDKPLTFVRMGKKQCPVSLDSCKKEVGIQRRPLGVGQESDHSLLVRIATSQSEHRLIQDKAASI